MKIAYVLEGREDDEGDFIQSTLLEDLHSTFGFNPKMDVPFCISYYDIQEVDESISSISGLIYQSLVFNSPLPDDTDNTQLSELIELIRQRGISLNWDELEGVDIIVNEEMSRILLTFPEKAE